MNTANVLEQIDALVPFDQHNQRLAENVHPPRWQNPTPEGRYNLVVIGAGTAGLVSAAGAAGLGAKVALVERQLMGGDCLNVGCVPSKALLATAHAAAAIRRAKSLGIDSPSPRVDFAGTMERMRRLRAQISPVDSAARFRDLGVDVYLGEASFLGPHSIEIKGQELTFKRCIMATGARAAVPDIKGLNSVSYLTNETLFSLTELPRRLAVLGGGPIGCEMAQAFAHFGAEVTLLERSAGVLANDDHEAAKIICQSLRDSRVNLQLNTSVIEARPTPQGIGLKTQNGSGSHDLEVDQLLVAAGRAPNVEGLQLERANIDYDSRRGVMVDDRLRTTNKNIYAAGDICSRFKFTHAADAMARIAIRNALFLGRSRASRLTIPWCTYTSPELAQVGLHEQEAASQGISVDVYRQDWQDTDRAILEGDSTGFVKVLTQRGTDKIVGATVVGQHAGDLISELTAVMQSGMRLSALSNVIHPYPTRADALRKTGDMYNKSRLTPLVATLFKKWLSWTR